MHCRGRQTLDDRDTGNDNLLLPHFLDQSSEKDASIRQAYSFLLGPIAQHRTRRPREVAIAMVLLDRSQLLIPCRATPSEPGDRFRIRTDLFGNIIQHDRRQELPASQMPARIAQTTQLQGMTQARFRRATTGHRGKICGVQRVVADDLVFGFRQGQHRIALFLRH